MNNSLRADVPHRKLKYAASTSKHITAFVALLYGHHTNYAAKLSDVGRWRGPSHVRCLPVIARQQRHGEAPSLPVSSSDRLRPAQDSYETHLALCRPFLDTLDSPRSVLCSAAVMSVLLTSVLSRVPISFSETIENVPCGAACYAARSLISCAAPRYNSRGCLQLYNFSLSRD